LEIIKLILEKGIKIRNIDFKKIFKYSVNNEIIKLMLDILKKYKITLKYSCDYNNLEIFNYILDKYKIDIEYLNNL
jgi:hypothetical protein